jgi:hypothetical protein
MRSSSMRANSPPNLNLTPNEQEVEDDKCSLEPASRVPNSSREIGAVDRAVDW